MEQINMIQLLSKLQNGEDVVCPQCKTGHFTSSGDPKTAHSFKCTECGARVNID